MAEFDAVIDAPKAHIYVNDQLWVLLSLAEAYELSKTLNAEIAKYERDRPKAPKAA